VSTSLGQVPRPLRNHARPNGVDAGSPLSKRDRFLDKVKW
jgi:hypothetical protein